MICNIASPLCSIVLKNLDTLKLLIEMDILIDIPTNKRQQYHTYSAERAGVHQAMVLDLVKLRLSYVIMPLCSVVCRQVL